MSVFRIPVGVAKEIEKMQRSFFWGDGCMKRKLHAVSWDILCKSKRNGGLGIGRIQDKNKSFLAKWVWRFGKEDNAFWRRIICSKYNVRQSSLVCNWRSGRKDSWFIKAIGSLFGGELVSSKIIAEGMTIVVGNGSRASFWHDPLVMKTPLKLVCPRLYALAAYKEGVVADFGMWINSVWSWKVPLRRPVFGWEKREWDILMVILGCFNMQSLVSDSIC
jgi:hypothetical protein